MFSSRRSLMRVAAGSAAALLLGLAAPAASAATPDAPGSYTRVTTTSTQNTWLSGTVSSTRDVDVYRFRTSASRYARVLLGDLGADYRVRLLNSTGHVLATSDRAGLANEEIYRALAAGTYYVAVDAPHGRVSTTPYALRFTSLPEGLVLLSQHAYGSGASRELDFEVLNNTSHTIDGVQWYYDFHCTATGSTDCGPPSRFGEDRVLPPRSRASFYDQHVPTTGGWTLKVMTGAAINFSSRLSIAVTSTTRTTSGYKVTGTWTNAANHQVCYPTITRNDYDRRGGLIAQYELWSSNSPYAALHTVHWSATLPPLPSGTVRTAWRINEVAAGGGC